MIGLLKAGKLISRLPVGDKTFQNSILSKALQSFNVGEIVIWDSKIGPVNAEYRGKLMGMDGYEATIIVREENENSFQITIPISQLRKKSVKKENYRGWRIERIEAWNIGYDIPARSSSTISHRGRGRQFNGFEIFYPDSSGSKVFTTLREARAYIDRYEGDENKGEVRFRAKNKLTKSAADPKVGEQYDDFGYVWEVTRVDRKRREVTIRRDEADQFGRNVSQFRSIHFSHLQHMRQVKSHDGKTKIKNNNSISRLPVFVRKDKGSYFSICERDDEGHCLPSSQAGEGGTRENGKKPQSEGDHASHGQSSGSDKDQVPQTTTAPATDRHASSPKNDLPHTAKESAVVSAATEKRAKEEYSSLKEEYLKKGGGSYDKDGNLTSVTLNTDDWRDLFEEYHGTNAGDVHKASSYLNKKLFAETLESMKGKGNNTMVVLAGGGGSGKGGVGKYMDLEQYPIKLDQVSDDVERLKEKMDEARKAGYKVDYVFVDRNPEEAWLDGVVKRALNSRKKGENARTVSIEIALQANLAARKAAISTFKNDRNIPVQVLDNTKGAGESRLITNRGAAIDHLTRQVDNYPRLLRRMKNETMRRYSQGEIPEDIAIGLLGETTVLGKHAKKKGWKNESQRVHEQRKVSENNSGRIGVKATDDARRLQLRSVERNGIERRGNERGPKSHLGGTTRQAKRSGLRANSCRDEEDEESERGFQTGKSFALSKGKGTCEQGQTAAQTGCTPAEGDSKVKPQFAKPQQTEERTNKGDPDWYLNVLTHDDDWVHGRDKEGRLVLVGPREDSNLWNLIANGGSWGTFDSREEAISTAESEFGARLVHPKAHAAAKQMKGFLDMGIGLGTEVYNSSPTAKFHTSIEYVKSKGKEFLGQPLPKNIQRGTPKQCFANATHLVVAKEGWNYAEGFAMRDGLLPVLHAWAVDDKGGVVDNTFEDPEHCAYVGIVYDRKKYMKHILKKKFYGLLGGRDKDSVGILQRGGI